MNDDEFSEKPSGSMLGKEFIIVLVIFFSGLSFTLGYFVGKSGTPGPEPALQAVEPSGQLQKQELLPVPASPAAALAPEQTQAVLPTIKEPVSPVAPVTERIIRQQTANETKTRPPQIKEKEQQKSSEAEVAKSATGKSTQDIEPPATAETKSAIYTVQIGAFKNIAEAKQLKAKFDRKGYKSFISTGKNKKAEKVFKVKTGEFREKKEAELLALKLKKTEALQTYVTLKTE